MMTLNDLKQQVELYHRIPAEERIEREEVRIRVIKESSLYFRQRLVETKGLITAELMHEVDEVYDIHGMPSAIAKVLGITVNHIQGALAKERSVPCKDGCGRSLTKIMRRRLGGYTDTSDGLCSRCRNKRQEEANQREKSHLQVNERFHQWLAMDRWLSETKEPLSSACYEQHLYKYYKSWIEGSWAYSLDTHYQHFWYEPTDTTGCMFCGADQVLLYLIDNELIPSDSDFYHIVNRVFRIFQTVSENDYIWPTGESVASLRTYHQALWALTPDEYFSYNLGYPIGKRPLLLLCPKCGVLVEQSHIVIKFEDNS